MVLNYNIFPDNDWIMFFTNESKKKYFSDLNNFLTGEYTKGNIYPEPENIFNAFRYSSLNKTDVVILGQDPYHNENQACGLAFSVKPDIKIPPSLKNIYKEIKRDIGCDTPDNGVLISWAEQGILLLNTVLTVRENEPGSHRKKGWEIFTDEVIKLLSKKGRIIFLLWGNNAREKESIIDIKRNTILTAPHPSPLSASRGFFGCSHFSETNKQLSIYGKRKINWQIDNL